MSQGEGLGVKLRKRTRLNMGKRSQSGGRAIVLVINQYWQKYDDKRS